MYTSTFPSCWKDVVRLKMREHDEHNHTLKMYYRKRSAECQDNQKATWGNYKCPFGLLYDIPSARKIKAYWLFLHKCYIVLSCPDWNSACVCPSIHWSVTLKMRCCQAHVWHIAILRNKRAIVQLTHMTLTCHRQSVYPSVFLQPQWTVCKWQDCTLDCLPDHCRGHTPFIHT